MKHKRISYIFLLILTLTGTTALLSCSTSPNEQNISAQGQSPERAEVKDSGAVVTLTREQFKIAGIRLGNIEKKSIIGSLNVSGMVEVPPQSKISVSFPYGGFVKNIKVLEGSYVKKGSLLAVIENPEFVDLQESYLKSKSSLEYAEQEYERQKQLYEADVAAGKSYQKASSEYHALQASVEAMAQKLNMLEISGSSLKADNIRSSVSIYAPGSGYITKITANQGKYIDAQSEMMELDNMQDVHVDLTVYEKDVDKLKKGQTVQFSLAGSDKKEAGKVTLIGRAIRKDRSVVVHTTPLNKDKYYMPGTYVQATIQLKDVATESLPDEAVVRTNGKQYIFIKQVTTDSTPYSYQMIPVTLGSTGDGYVQIEFPSGMHLSDNMIVVKGAFSLLSVLKNSSEEE